MSVPELLGRGPALTTLRQVVDRGGFALVTGDAGIGKTSLVSAVAGRSEALVLTGACWGDAGVPDRWPWVQVTRALRAAATAAEWAGAAAVLEGLLGEREPAAFPLADALTGLLTTLAARRRVLLVLEDLHWADPASVTLLEFVVQHTRQSGLAIVCTYRDGEVTDPALLALSAKAVHLALSGLDEESVADLVTRTTGLAPDAELVAQIHRRTAGNPFFVEQTARLWQGGGPLDTVDPGITALLNRRLSRLPEQVIDLLGTVAILGPAAQLDLLTALHPGAEVHRLLGQALAARLIRQDGEHIRFQHDLLRDTVLSGLSEIDAPARHAAVVRAAADPALAAVLLPAELAHHAHHGAAALPAAEVLRHQLTAAENAATRLAFAEAARHYRRALPHAADPRERARIQLQLGEAAHQAGDPATARATFTAAMAAARELADPELKARTALTLLGLHPREHADPGHLAFIHEVHAELLPGSPAGHDQTAADLSRHAVELARRVGDDDALRFALLAQLGSLWSLGTAPARAEITTELLALAARTHDDKLHFEATSWHAAALLEQGDPAHRGHHRRLQATAARTGLLAHRHEVLVAGCLLALLHGDFAAARTHADQARDAGEQPSFYVAAHDLWTAQRVAIALRQGELAEAADLLAGSTPGSLPLFEAQLAVRRRDFATARRLLAESPVSRWDAALSLHLRTELAIRTGDHTEIAALRKELALHADHWATTGTVILQGPVRSWLAQLDAAAGDLPEAISGFRQLIQAADALGARPWAAEARAHLALALRHQGDTTEAGTLLATAETEATALGMPLPTPECWPFLDPVLAETAHQPPVPAAAPASAPANGRATSANTPYDNGQHAAVFRRGADTWTLSFAGTTVHLPDSKGLRDLHHLLSSPTGEAPATHLLSPSAPAVVTTAAPVLDDTAKAAYRRRLAALDEQLDQAVDDATALALDREREALIHELRAATGLLGRSRRLGDDAERARKAVTNRIRDTLRRLDSRHPELAAHLRESVFTGTICRYRPINPVRWRL